MKNNHIKLENLIRQGIEQCSYDDVLEDTKKYLYSALNAVQQVAKKRTRMAISQQEALADGRRKYEQWWEMIKRNASGIDINDNDIVIEE